MLPRFLEISDFIGDQEVGDSIIQTQRVYRGTNKYDPLSTHTSLTRKTTSTEVFDENLEHEPVKVGNSFKYGRQLGAYSNRRDTVQNIAVRPSYRRSSSESSSPESKRVLKSPRGGTAPLQKSTTTNRPKTISTTPTIALTTMSRGYSRVRVQNGATTVKRTSDSNVDGIDEENYPEHFKTILKEKFKTKSRQKEETKPTKSYSRSTRQPTRLPDKTTRFTSTKTTSKPDTTQRKTEVNKANNLRVLFPTRKSSTKPVSTTESFDNENYLEPTLPAVDYSSGVKYSEADFGTPTKPSFFSKSKYNKSAYGKQLATPFKKDSISSTVKKD